MRIGIVGSGDVARALAMGLHRHGHDIAMGTRNLAQLAEWQRLNPQIGLADSDRVVRAAEVVVLAVRGTAAVEVVTQLSDALTGRVVIDATNPLADGPPERGVLRYFTGPNESLMERLQAACPEARFVKAFNQVGNADMVDPKFQGGPPSMFICGNDAAAKATVAALLRQVGWEPEDFGGVEAARAIEPLCMLWCIRGFAQGQWHHAFKLLK